MKPRILVLTGYGINCEEETAKCFELAGGIAEIVHVNDLIENPKKLSEYQILAFPGGFSYGDDTGSGNALANKIRNNLQDEVLNFAHEDKLIIGICNGFQVLVNLGLVPAIDNNYGERTVALMHNKQTRFECRWIHIKNNSEKCIWTRGVDMLHVPIAHGEGNFYTKESVFNSLKANDQIVFKYVRPDGLATGGEFPYNPNGSMEDIAGICDESGRILGLMPHPERFNSFVNEYGWEKKKEELIRAGRELPKEGEGLKLFRNAVGYFG